MVTYHEQIIFFLLQRCCLSHWVTLAFCAYLWFKPASAVLFYILFFRLAIVGYIHSYLGVSSWEVFRTIEKCVKRNIHSKSNGAAKKNSNVKVGYVQFWGGFISVTWVKLLILIYIGGTNPIKICFLSNVICSNMFYAWLGSSELQWRRFY